MESFDAKPKLTELAGKTIGETKFAFVQDPERLKKVRVVVRIAKRFCINRYAAFRSM